MPWWYPLLKTVHILSAITAVGANLTYGVWARSGRVEEAHLGFALRGIKLIDDRIANPAYGVLLATGITMWLTTWPLGTRWIITGLVLYAVVAVLGIFVVSPAMRRQLAALDAQGAQSEEYRLWASRTQGIGMFLAVAVIAIVFVMVFKPTI